MMTTLEAVGLVASVIAIFEAGYVIGVLRTNKRRRASEDDLIANRVRQVLGAIRIKEVECDARELFTGQTIPMSLIIASDAASPIEAWIGASLLDESEGEYYDTSQDKLVLIVPGTNTYRRSLTVPSNVDSGEYSLYCAVWLGQVAHPERSIKLDQSKRDGRLKIHKR
jgi:hypothetical protein